MGSKEKGTIVNLSSDKLLKQYAGYEIKIRSHHLHRSGLDIQSSFLKIDKYELSFVPYTLSLTKCRFLVSMSQAEIELFNTLLDGSTSVKLAFDSDIWDRTVEFLLWGKIESITRANPALNVALISFSISRVANTYREIFLDLCLDNDRLLDLYNSEETGRVAFDGECFADVFGSQTVTLMPGTRLTRPFEVRSFSLKTMVLYGPVPPERTVVDSLVKVVLVNSRPPLVVDGTIRTESHSPDGGTFREISMDTDFSPDLAEIMRPFLKTSA